MVLVKSWVLYGVLVGSCLQRVAAALQNAPACPRTAFGFSKMQTSSYPLGAEFWSRQWSRGFRLVISSGQLWPSRASQGSRSSTMRRAYGYQQRSPVAFLARSPALLHG